MTDRPSNDYGHSPPPRGQWQKVLNTSWPKNPRDIKDQKRIPVTVRVVFEHDGEQRLEGAALRWKGQHVCVAIDDHRLQVHFVWLDAADVRRR